LDVCEQVGGDLLWGAFAVELHIREFTHSRLLDGAGTVEVPADAVAALATLEPLREHVV
jgi:hypothetical protein